MNTKRTYISLAIAACVIVIIFIAASAVQRAAPASASVDASSVALENDGTQSLVATATSSTPASDLPKSKYRDGTYTAIGSYDSPAGQESINVSVTLKNGIVTAAKVTQMAQDRTSIRYQQRFISGYLPLVVGKNIGSIRLDVVSGSSLTPIGFNAALAKIKAQAQAAQA